MYYIIKIKNKKYIFFPFSLRFFRYTEELEKEINSKQHYEIQKILKEERDIQEKIQLALQTYYQGKHKIAASEINTIHACNMMCRYCFANGGNHGKKGSATPKTIEKIYSFIIQNASKNELKITIVGGEPFLDFSNFKKVVEYANKISDLNKKQFKFSAISNGIELDEERISFLKKNKVNLVISLDSGEKDINDYLRPMRQGTSSYLKVMENMEFFKSLGRMNINVTVTPYNLNISEIARFMFDKLNAKSIHFGEVISNDPGMEFTNNDIEKLMEEYNVLADIIIEKYNEKDYVHCYPLTPLEKIHRHIPVIKSCSALKNRCAFSPEGNIYPCDVMMYDEYCIGNVDRGFDEKRIRDLREMDKDDSWCKDCWARYLCGGECLALKSCDNRAQKELRCKLKRHIYKLRLYIYDSISNDISQDEMKKIFGGI